MYPRRRRASRRLGWLWATLATAMATGAEAPAEERLRVRDFGPEDSARERWTDADGQKLSLGTVDAAHGESLLVPVAFPGAAEAWRGGGTNPAVSVVSDNRPKDTPVIVPDWFQFDLHLPEDLPPGLRIQARLVLKNKDGYWFDGLGRRRIVHPDGAEEWVRATALHPGWNTVRVDLRETAADMHPKGHAMAWSRYVMAQARSLAIVVQGDREWTGTVAVDNVVTRDADDRFDAPLRLMDFAPPGADPLPLGGLAAWSFRLNRPVLNPFRQTEVAVDLVVTPPEADKPIILPGFYDIAHRRLRGMDGPGPTDAEPDQWQPEGTGHFRFRYRPRREGVHRWTVRARYRSPISGVEETVESPEGELVVGPWPDGAASEAKRGFVRVSERDRRCFEFENGDFFFPLGHSFRSPADPRHVERILSKNWPKDPAPPDRDLRIYEDLFPRMAAAGINTTEVWMASWWLDLEWTGRWKNYHGLQGYNLVNANRMDALLELADRHNQYIHLTLDNHGKASARPNVDPEWPLSPYNVENGGPVEEVNDYFADVAARALYRDKLRYVMARWSHSPRIFGWELWSELDLTGTKPRDPKLYQSEAVREWHGEMAGYIHETDPARRPVTTHYSGHYGYVDWKLMAKPFMDYVCCDAYADNPRDRLVEMLRMTEMKALPLDKPFMVTEFGGGAYAAPLKQLNAHQYAGLWWGWHSQTAGAPFFWWYELIVKADYYPVYRAFTNYIAGEDKRRGPDEPPLISRWPYDLLRQTPKPDGKLSALLLADGNVFYVWLYDVVLMENLPDDHGPEEKGITLRLGSAGTGSYRVEIWDCWTGTVLETRETRPGVDGILRIPLPPFRAQLAVKAKALEPRTRAAITEPPRPEKLPPEPEAKP